MAVHVEVVQFSLGLTWKNGIIFCMYLLSVTVCATVYR